MLAFQLVSHQAGFKTIATHVSNVAIIALAVIVF